MSDVNVAIIYYSTYGLNHQMASVAAEAASEAGAEVRLLKVRETAPEAVIKTQDAWLDNLERTKDIPEASPDDMRWGDAYLFSSPTRYGGAASQMRAFIDTLGPLWMEGQLADKPVTAMTSAMNDHGGQETTLQSMYVTFMHWGAIVVPVGYTDQSIYGAGGNPYGVSVTAGEGQPDDAKKAAIRHQARRLVQITSRLKKGG